MNFLAGSALWGVLFNACGWSVCKRKGWGAHSSGRSSSISIIVCGASTETQLECQLEQLELQCCQSALQLELLI
jgi:hypothetical protein